MDVIFTGQAENQSTTNNQAGYSPTSSQVAADQQSNEQRQTGTDLAGSALAAAATVRQTCPTSSAMTINGSGGIAPRQCLNVPTQQQHQLGASLLSYTVCTETTPSSNPAACGALVTEFNTCATASLSVQLPLTSLDTVGGLVPPPSLHLPPPLPLLPSVASTDKSTQHQTQRFRKRRRLASVESGTTSSAASCRKLRSLTKKANKTGPVEEEVKKKKKKALPESLLNKSMLKPCETRAEGLAGIDSYHRRPAPFSHEPEAQLINEQCDYSRRVTYDEAMANTAHRVARVYADGVYDMFHSGHARQLMQAKNALPNVYLMVGVCNDQMVERYKGRVVMNETERYEAVRHCRYVDEVVTNAPWSITDDFLREHKIDFVAHDEIPYASSNSEDVYKPLKDAGMFIVTQRTEGISTTDVIGRIVRDYDIYLRRNIKRGLSRHDLNISYVKEKQLKLQDNFEHIMRRGSSFIQNFDTKRRELVDHLEDMSHEVVRSFMRIFGSDGRLRNWLHPKQKDGDGGTTSSSPSPSSLSSSPLSSTSSVANMGHSELAATVAMSSASTDDEDDDDQYEDASEPDELELDRQNSGELFPNHVPDRLLTPVLNMGDKLDRKTSSQNSAETGEKLRRSSRVHSLTGQETSNGPDYPVVIRKELSSCRTAKESRKMIRKHNA